MKLSQLPIDAPYNEGQRAWLSGFFAGMHAHMIQSASFSTQTDSRTITILYGSQTGSAEAVANDAGAVAKAYGLKPLVKCMDEIEAGALLSIDYLLVITSTYGEGEMPDNAQMLWDSICSEVMPRLEGLKYSVLALGDTSYDLFCQAGIDWDNKLTDLGATRIYDRTDCDVDYEEPAERWITSVIPHMAGENTTIISETDSQPSDKPVYHRKNPFPGTLVINRLLTDSSSSKEIRHYEVSIIGSGLSYEAGDALCVVPTNCPKLVADIIKAIGCKGDEDVPVNGDLMLLETALRTHFEIKTPSKELVEEIAMRSGDQDLNGIIESGDKQKLADYLWGRDTLDLLLQLPDCELTAAEFIALLKPLQHRAYSISSSGKKYPEAVHLTVASVRYDSYSRHHKGVCSTFLADLIDAEANVRCFFTPNKVFRVPENDNLPIIMVGPGTGIAPFRAFLQERGYRKASGKNWLFFGDRNVATDYIYRDELESFQKSGLLTRLDLAFSRDQEAKIYVQDRMHEQGAELYLWLEQGGYFYVCGDAYKMAKDVDQALHAVIAKHGKLSEQQAIDYVNQLKKDKRYVRDVY